MAEFLLGKDAKVYYLNTGTRATWGTITDGVASGAAPSGLTEIAYTKGDIKATLNGVEADVTVRAGNGWKLTAKAGTDASYDFDIQKKPGDTAYAAIQKAFLTGGSIAIAVLDGDKATAGTEGLWADFSVTKFDVNHAFEGSTVFSVTIKPTLAAVMPEWVKVTSGS